MPKTLGSLPLELGSVDRHWAVPGGLSMDIARRVLAVMPAAVKITSLSVPCSHDDSDFGILDLDQSVISCRTSSRVDSLPNYDCAQEWLTGLKAQLWTIQFSSIKSSWGSVKDLTSNTSIYSSCYWVRGLKILAALIGSTFNHYRDGLPHKVSTRMQWKYPLPRKCSSRHHCQSSLNLEKSPIKRHLSGDKSFSDILERGFPGNWIQISCNEQPTSYIIYLISPTCLLRHLLIFWRTWYYRFSYHIDSESHLTKSKPIDDSDS